MATYTDNYQLTLPGYADVADVADLNHNATIIDEIMHGSQVSLAPGYDSTQTYNTGDVVMYGYKMYKCITDGVTGAWDPTEWEPTTASEVGGSSDPDYYGTVSGDPASFADGAAAGLVKCETDFEPKQDLHGYDKPWAGGAGKNKLDKSNFSDVTTAFKSLLLTLKPNTTYTMSSTIPKNSGNTANSFFYLPGVTPTTNNNGIWNGQTRTITTGADGEVRVGYRAEGFSDTSPEYYMSFDFQVEEGSTATTHEPYSNICPIEGYDDITINVSPTSDTSQGVDTTIQLGDTYYSGTLNVVTGELVIDKIFVEMDDVTWTGLDSSGNKYRYYTDIVGMKKMAVRSMDILCSCYETNMGGGSWDDNTIWNSTNLNRVIVVTSQYQTANAFMASLTDQTMLVDMETPLVIQLPPTTINTLLGQNYVSSDTGAVDVIYIKSAAPIIPNAAGDSSGDLNSIGLGGKVFTIPKELPAPPATDGAYKLRVTVTDGAPTFSWVSDT